MLFCVATILKVSLPTGMVLFFLLWVYRPIHTYLYLRRYISSSTYIYIYIPFSPCLSLSLYRSFILDLYIYLHIHVYRYLESVLE